jgi:hypothetical protein
VGVREEVVAGEGMRVTGRGGGVEHGIRAGGLRESHGGSGGGKEGEQA